MIHIYMGMPQGNSYLKQTKMLSYFFYKIREQEGRTDPISWGWYQLEGEGCGKWV
jgi:hypothetical protein